MTIEFHTAKAALIAALLGPVTVVTAQESTVSLSAFARANNGWRASVACPRRS